MGIKAKYSKETKLIAIQDYLDGKKSASQLSYEIGFYVNNLYLWVKLYQQFGESIIDDKPKNSTYTKEFKLMVVQEYLSGNGSLIDLVSKYNIFSDSTIRKWILMYNNSIELKDYNPMSEVYTMKARKTTLEERIEIVKYCLDHDRNYKETASKFLVPYSLVYQWVQRYEKDGDTGLSYTKKGPKPKNFDTTETLEAKLEKLQKELERVKFENEVLKKNVNVN